MALERASGQKFLNFSLEEYRDHFPKTRWHFPNWRLHRLVRAAILGLKHISGTQSWFVRLNRENAGAYSPDNPEFLAEVNRRRLTIIEGWPDPSRISFPTAAAHAIRSTFKPARHVLRVARQTVKRARRGSDLLVGVHIRLTDYREYRSGIFYYPLSVYQRTMSQMSKLLSGRRVAFLVCSDEPQRAADFAPFPVTIGPGSELGDLHSLASCDYVVGPPSTYSLWAAFYGNKPLYHMIRPTPPPSLSAFSIPDGRFDCIDLKLDELETTTLRQS